MSASTRANDSPTIGREGVYFHKPSGQFVSRLGFELNPKGDRVRAFQYLGGNPETATVKHVGIVARWKWTKANWSEIETLIRPGLPETFRETADLRLAVWIKTQWWDNAHQAGQADLIETLLKSVNEATTLISKGKRIMKVIADPEQKYLAELPAQHHGEVFEALAPAAHEVMGVTSDAKRLTVEQAKKEYLDDCRSRIKLPEDGIKPATYQNTDRMLRLGLALQKNDGSSQCVIAPEAMLDSIARDDLVVFKRGWLGKVTAGEIKKRTAANYCKAVQFFLAWCYRRDRIISRRVSDLEELFRFTDINPINIAEYSAVKDDLKTILKAATDRVKLYIYLALNCGHYQVDIGNLKLDEIQLINGEKFIARKRDKTSHQNNFISCHLLWPETWKLLESQFAPADPVLNPDGLALLNENGGPLYVGADDAAKIDNVTSAYWRVIQSINADRANDKLPAISLPFKQFRKLGATAMNDIADETCQKLYRAANFDGSDKFYVRGDFTKLTAALKKWRKLLQADGVLS